MNSQTTTQTRAAEANKVKEIVVRTMVSEGYISKDKADDFLSKYAIVEHQQGWLGSTIDRFIKNKTDAFYRIVKILH